MFGITYVSKDLSDKEQQSLDEVLATYNFFKQHERFYVNKYSDLTDIIDAMNDLKELHWFVKKVIDIRAFALQNLSDFTYYLTVK